MTISSGTNIPSTDGYHLGIGRHEQLGTVSQILVALDSHPRVLGSLGIQWEQEGFAGAKVGLSLALVIFNISFEPAGRAIGTKYL